MILPDLFYVDIQKMCDIKGPLHAYFIDKNNVFLACNKLKLDFCEDILGTRDVIGRTPFELLEKNPKDIATIESCYLENQAILENGVPKQSFHFWLVKGLYRLDLLTFKIPIYNAKKESLGIFNVSHFINKFSVQKAYDLGLSTRETECLFYLLEGHTAKEIARAIQLSPRTIEGYIENMKIKLECSNTSELLLKALQSEIKEGINNPADFCLPLGGASPLSKSMEKKTAFSSLPTGGV